MEKDSWRHLSHRTIHLLFVDTHEWNYISKRLVNYLETKYNMKTLFLYLLLLFAGGAMAQTESVVPPPPGQVEPVQGRNDAVYTYVEQMPEYPGGNDAMMEFIRKNLRYPEIAKEAGVEGRVIIRFVVDEFGAISDIKILKDIGGGCGAEACRVIKMMPKWKPGKQNGKAVKTYFTLPVTFRLN